MRDFFRIWAGFVLVFILSGCGGSGSLEPTAEQDELEQWVNQNPAPEEVPLEDGEAS